MYFLLNCLILPIINAIVIVQIHRSSIYRPASACAFLSNTSWSTDTSIQSCIWECTYENSCQTAIYFSEKNVCSMFAEVCESDGIQSSGSVQASVICCRKNQEASVTCSSNLTSKQVEEEKTTVPDMMTSATQTLTTKAISTSIPPTTVKPISINPPTTVIPTNTVPTTTVDTTSTVSIKTVISTSIDPTTTVKAISIDPTTTVIRTDIVPTTTVDTNSTVSIKTVISTSIDPTTTVKAISIDPTTTVIRTDIVPTTTVDTNSTVSIKTVISTSIDPTATVIPSSIVPATKVIPTSTVPATTMIPTRISPTITVDTTSTLSIKTVISTSIIPTTTVKPTAVVPTTSAITTTKVTTTERGKSATTATAVPIISIFWNFDNNTNDLYNVYNGVPSSTSYSPLGITGYGAALSLTNTAYCSTGFSFVSVSSPYLNLQNRSFTVDVWVHPGTTMYANDYLIVALCPSATNYKCMQALIRSGKPLLSFYYDDCESSNLLNVSTWVHLAYVYDYASNMMTLYVNGYLDTNCAAVSPFQLGPSAPLYIGGTSVLTMCSLALIDQLSIVTRVKSASEILTTATLVIYYSFDNQSLLDSGPNSINGTGINIAFAFGRVHDAIVFNITRSYVQINNLVLFGTKYWPYSFAFWIYPYSTKNGTLIHMWKPSAPTNFCMPMIGFSASGSIVGQTWNSTGILPIAGPVIAPNTWTHIAHTYSPTGDIRLFVNGTLMVSSPARSMNPAASAPLTIALGYCVNTTLCSCASGSVIPGQCHGLMDEFQLYSRQLNTSEVLALANP